MARDYYETTIALPDAADGYAMKPLTGVMVSVVPRGATDVPNSLVDVYPADTGVTKGPDPKSGSLDPSSIQFRTGASGSVRFWAEGPAELDIVFEDTITPSRIADRIGWNCIPAKSGSIPTSYLAQDGGIKQSMLSAEVVYQQVPIGGVMEWWRPPGSTANPPAGYEVADGRAITAHEFPTMSGAVTLPNLQNCFIIGATVGKSDGSGAGNDNLPGSGPGIRGTGGSNTPKDLRHGHGVPMIDHYHSYAMLDHWHGASGLTTGGHGHGVGTSDGNNSTALVAGSPTGSGVSRGGHTHSGWTDSLGNLGVYGNTTWSSGGSGNPSGNTSYVQAWSGGSGTSATNSTTWTADPGTEFRPYFYGLLRLIKARRTA